MHPSQLTRMCVLGKLPGTFYWHSSCDEAGRGGIPRAWSAYVCLGDGWPWDSYDLYVKY